MGFVGTGFTENEESCIIPNLNLHEFSQVNKNEMRVFLSSKMIPRSIGKGLRRFSGNGNGFNREADPADLAWLKKKLSGGYPKALDAGYGDEGDRTPDLSIANAALSQLSYIPTRQLQDYNRWSRASQSKKTCVLPVEWSR